MVLAARLDSLLQQTCMALFLNIFIVTSNSSVSIYIGIFVAACSHCFSGLLQGEHLRQSGPSMAAILSWSGGTIYGNIICRRWSGGPVVAGDQLRRDSSSGRIVTLYMDNDKREDPARNARKEANLISRLFFWYVYNI